METNRLTSLFSSGLTSLSILLPPPLEQHRDGEWGLWSVHNTLSLWFLCPLFLCSSMGSHPGESFKTFSNVVLSHRLQFFTKCSSMSPFHRWSQYFRKWLLHRGSPTGLQVLTENSHITENVPMWALLHEP